MDIWAHRTNKGRVVYDRKPHLFTVRDVERIMEKVLDEAEKPRPRLDSERIWRKILEFYQKTGTRFLFNLLDLGISGGLTPGYVTDRIRELLESYREVIDKSNLLSWDEVSNSSIEERMV